MKDMLLVDNAVYSFGMQLSNAIPVLPFKYDKTDDEFLTLKEFLPSISQYDDLREPVKEVLPPLQEMRDRYIFNDFIDYYDPCEIDEEFEMDEKYRAMLEKQISN